MTWQIILGLLLVLTGFLNLFNGFFLAVLLIFIGSCFIYAWAAKKEYVSKPSKKQNPDTKTGNERKLITEIYKSAGTSYYESNIKKLAVKNQPWQSNVKTLVSKGYADKRVYRYNFINKPVKLIPEPTNAHDKNAVMIQIAGEKVGYIPADQAVHVKNILSQKEIKYISAFIGGGEYKIILDDNTFAKFEEGFSVTVKIGYAEPK